ncbi:hypothetical protein, partial [Nocardiopsis protaetiae]
MPEPTVIVTFDVTEPHLQHCLDSLSRQTGLGEGRAALGEGEPASGADAGIEVVLVPVRPA